MYRSRKIHLGIEAALLPSESEENSNGKRRSNTKKGKGKWVRLREAEYDAGGLLRV